MENEYGCKVKIKNQVLTVTIFSTPGISSKRKALKQKLMNLHNFTESEIEASEIGNFYLI
jgi:hypothetical protein